MHQRTLNIWIAITSILAPFQRVSAQDTNAICLASYAWANNSIQQSPCTVGSYLQGVCNGGSFMVTALPDPSNEHYVGPTASNVNPCQCSSVVYSLISACAACQGGDAGILSWDSWSQNCTEPYIGYHGPIPLGTAVPAWTYLNVTTVGGGTFNVTAAQLDIDAPEHTPSPNSTMTTTSSNRTSNATTIAVGATIGAMAGILILTGAGWWLHRRRASIANARRCRLRGSFLASPSEDRFILFQNDSQDSFPAMHTQKIPMMTYNPEDPNTFPRPEFFRFPPPGAGPNGSPFPGYTPSIPQV